MRGTTTAIEDVTLDVPPGEFVTIVGPSGCGKSTILNLVAGLDKATTGEVLVADRPVTGPGSDRIMVFQEHALFPWLDVTGNVEFGMKTAGVPKAERATRATEALRMVQLERFAKSRVHELSGGMKQRVALARALVLRPQVLLMDEPFAALDAQTRDSLQHSLQELWLAERPTVLFVTHNVREAACLGSRIVVLTHRPGRVKTILHNAAPHPREIEDAGTVELSRRIKVALEGELEEQTP